MTLVTSTDDGCLILLQPYVILRIQSQHAFNSTMPLAYPSAENSVISILLGKSLYYRELFDRNRNDNLDKLVNAARTVVSENAQALKKASIIKGYRLDNLLFAMLDHAPHVNGKIYVATVLQIAKNKGPGVVVKVAEAWGYYIFLKCEFLVEVLHVP